MISTPPLFTVSIRRRAAALLAALCVLGAQAEYLLPDEHDGHATAEEVVIGAASEDSPTTPTDVPASQPGHTVHVEHCVHAHVFATGALPNENNSFTMVAGTPETLSQKLASISAAPHRRPPIA